MPENPHERYWLDDDDFSDGFGDDSDDSNDDDDQDDYNGDSGDDQDELDPDEEEPQAAGDAGGGDDGGDDDYIEPPDLDPDVALSADDFPNATAADFEDDDGAWSPDDYQQSAQSLFGDHEFFGENMADQRASEGFQLFEEPGILQGFEEVAPGASETVQLFERDGHLSAFGFVTAAMLELLRERYTGIDLSNLEVAVPDRGDRVQPQPLPPAFDSVPVQDAVDLRKYASPVGDQGQTSRCSAFAWTHAAELIETMKTGQPVRLSPTYSMLEFQRMQGDAQDFSYAYAGGDGTVGGPDPGLVLAQQGTCRQELWPDDREAPVTSERTLAADAVSHRLDATPHPIAIDDVRKALSAGSPVHVAMNTGSAFSNVGRAGVFNAAEPPSGRHGRHAMLIVGYTGNYYTVKNSWGEEWGDRGYAYIPKNVMVDSDPEFVAALVKKDA